MPLSREAGPGTEGLPPREERPARIPWIVAIIGVVTGVILITAVARLSDGDRGPLATFSMSEPDSALSSPSASGADAIAVRLQRFEHQAVTRSGERWRITAAALLTDREGLLLEAPELTLARGERVAIRLGGETGRIRPGEAPLQVGTATLRIGDDFELVADHLDLFPDGRLRGQGTVRVVTPHGESSGNGISIEPAEGKVTLGPGTPQQEVLRWTGWGRELIDLGEAYRNWSATTMLTSPQLVTSTDP